MKQFSARIYDTRELERAFQALQKNTSVSTSETVLFTVFSSSEFDPFIKKVQSVTREVFPGALLAGTSSSGEIFHGRLSEHSIVLDALCFDSTRIQTACYDLKSMTEEAAGKALADKACEIPDLVGIEILATVKSIDIKGFLSQLDSLDKNICIFGGGADSYLADSRTVVFGNSEILDKGIIVIFYSGGELMISADTCLGWKQVGRKMKITGLSGNNTVLELDRKPAFSIYEKYLKIENDEHFSANTAGFPIIFSRDGYDIARAPYSGGTDGSLTFSGDLRYGESVALSYGNPFSLIEGAAELRDKIMQNSPQAIFIFNCISRKKLLEGDSNQELMPFEDIADTNGFYTYGEIIRRGEEVEILNCSMIAVGFREGSPERCYVRRPELPKPDSVESEISLLQRLATFIDVTTKELEEANQKLSELARHDRLTELFSRGEIEELIRCCLEEFSAGGKKFSVVMADIDFFKHFNDKYGHDMGDMVLKKFSSILTQTTRSTDAVGRWGGEEFMILLPDLDAAHAAIAAERIRNRVETCDMGELPGKITVSLGVAEAVPAESIQELYKRVDNALYRAKQNGRNRVEIS